MNRSPAIVSSTSREYLNRGPSKTFIQTWNGGKMKVLSGVFTFLLLFVLSVTTASAGNLSIKVSKRNAAGGQGVDLANATVCVFNASTFEQLTTNSNGKATFPNFPTGNYTATAQKSGFVGQSLQFSFSGTDVTQFITLPEGAGGSICSPPPPPPPPPQNPDLVVHLVQSPPNSVTTEDTVTYGIGFWSNSGSGNVKVRFKFPNGFDLRSGSIEAPSGVTCTPGSLEINCTASRLSPNIAKTITIHGQYLDTGGAAQKQFSVSAQIDPDHAIAETNEANNTESLSTTVTARPDLVPDLTGSDALAVLGSPFAYSVKVRNVGKASAQGSQIKLTLPSQAVFSKFENSTFTNCQTPGGTGAFVCNAASLAPGASASVRVVAIANNDSTGPIMHFTAAVDPNQLVDESDNANNTLEITTTISDPRKPDLVVGNPGSSSWSCDVHAIPNSTGLIPIPSAPCCDGITISATVRNNGAVDSPAAQLKITFDKNKLESLCVSGDSFDASSCHCVVTGCTSNSTGMTCPFPALSAGNSSTFSIDLREFNRLDGSYRIAFTIDSGNDVPEEDESNNQTNFTAD